MRALCGNAVAAAALALRRAHDKAFLAPQGKTDDGENPPRSERGMLTNAKLRFPVRNEQRNVRRCRL